MQKAAVDNLHQRCGMGGYARKGSPLWLSPSDQVFPFQPTKSRSIQSSLNGCFPFFS
ncbi:hypothetical protein HMPREF3213_02524 [Heyndrickxia coagulans]|uniref:Uncharacterized protein n=1 Tax=Heyndrickxia coagulans TaxID=1398 RepID=A0A133KJS5_HEYCO|nr:hypothetical protein HMPREF3213_02524 [Heyndrickxia coagulans]